MSGRGGGRGGEVPLGPLPDGQAPESTDFANYFCTYAYIYHQVLGAVAHRLCSWFVVGVCTGHRPTNQAAACGVHCLNGLTCHDRRKICWRTQSGQEPTTTP